MEIGKGLSKYERETVASISDDEDSWHIYTCSPVMARKLAKIAELEREFSVGAMYRLPKNCVTFRNPNRKKRIWTEEQKQEAAERMRQNKAKN